MLIVAIRSSLGGLRPQRRAHAVVDERVGDHAREQAAAVDQLGPDLQADRLRVLPAHAHEAADAVERARPVAGRRASSPRASAGSGAVGRAARSVAIEPQATRRAGWPRRLAHSALSTRSISQCAMRLYAVDRPSGDRSRVSPGSGATPDRRRGAGCVSRQVLRRCRWVYRRVSHRSTGGMRLRAE